MIPIRRLIRYPLLIRAGSGHFSSNHIGSSQAEVPLKKTPYRLVMMAFSLVYTPGAFPGTPSATKPHAAVTEANACASSLELGGERVVINHRAPPSQ
ncbi:hypothetical protein CROQUDRAFT_92659 [Cronartium quercuum f. sp. fusiforme G11]|uniref:Uncharacterized protein n=1 Tax=Cronartium quercuum f. sp. fusiforme G11 TaxID=708437 RepID=A0A9P6NGI7_9BASI|nr:hypothetical protein CROQUDRAFT_92659 [Cronartium quercuum f. sp. fusiforme G11]